MVNSVHAELMSGNRGGENIVLACSALKQEYRDTLGAKLDMKIVYLRASAAQLQRNLRARSNHFAGEDLIPSQLATLEEPSGAIVEDIASTPEEIVEEICVHLNS